MPDVGKNAIQSWDGTGSQTIFVITFPYLARGHIEVAIDTGGGTWVVQTRPTEWDFSGSGATPSAVEFVTPPASGSANVRIRRITPHPTPLVGFQDRALVKAADLDTVIKQCIYYAEEIEDKI